MTGAVLKTVVTGYPGQAGSIPVRLRHVPVAPHNRSQTPCSGCVAVGGQGLGVGLGVRLCAAEYGPEPEQRRNGPGGGYLLGVSLLPW